MDIKYNNAGLVVAEIVFLFTGKFSGLYLKVVLVLRVQANYMYVFSLI